MQQTGRILPHTTTTQAAAYAYSSHSKISRMHYKNRNANSQEPIATHPTEITCFLMTNHAEKSTSCHLFTCKTAIRQAEKLRKSNKKTAYYALLFSITNSIVSTKTNPSNRKNPLKIQPKANYVTLPTKPNRLPTKHEMLLR